MTPTSDLRDSLAEIQSALERGNLDGDVLEACGVRLSTLGAEVSAALEAQFLLVVDEPGSSAA